MMNLKECVLIKAVQSFESVGFMSWHARVLRELTVTPQTIKEIARKVDLYHYEVRGVIQDLMGLQLVEYTRKGVSIVGDWVLLETLIACCEGEMERHSYDFEAAFEVVLPRVVALKKQFDFED